MFLRNGCSQLLCLEFCGFCILFYSILFYSIVWNPGVSRVEQLAQSRVEESVRPLLAGTVVCHNIPSGAPLAQLC